MTTATLHPMAADYLKRLRRAGRRLPRGALHDLVADVEAHLSETTDPAMSDAEMLAVLDRLGEPEAIVAAQEPDTVLVPEARGTHEWAAVFLLLFGGFVFGVGWIAGLILLWSSRAWTARDKWIGTLIWPGGLAAAIYFALGFALIAGGSGTCSSGPTVRTVAGKIIRRGGEHCTGGTSTGSVILWIVVTAVVVLAPIATSVYLARRAR